MKGIYLTTEAKQEIEAKIAEFEKPFVHYDGIYVSDEQLAKIDLLEEILSLAVILPVEESWNNISNNTFDRANNSEIYPQGVIIQSKQ
jgi:hypothetical protein